MKVLAEGFVHRGTRNTSTASCCFPAVVRLPDGRLLASWRTASKKDSADGTILLSISSDGGQTWQKPTQPFETKWRDQPGTLFYGPITVIAPQRLLAALLWFDRSEPDKPLYNPVTEGLWPSQTLLSESTDGGQSWSQPWAMDDQPWSRPLAISGPVLVLSDGRLACQFEVNNHYDAPPPWQHLAALKFSRDGGRTWPEQAVVASDPSGKTIYFDQRFAIGSGGQLAVAFWTYDRTQKRDLDVHLAFSSDCGQRWSAPRPTGLTGQYTQPIFLADGRLMLVTIDRFESRSIYAIVGSADGSGWGERCTVYAHSRDESNSNSALADYLQDQRAWTFGRVDAALEPEGTVFIIYYAGNPDATDIRWARVQI